MIDTTTNKVVVDIVPSLHTAGGYFGGSASKQARRLNGSLIYAYARQDHINDPINNELLGAGIMHRLANSASLVQGELFGGPQMR